VDIETEQKFLTVAMCKEDKETDSKQEKDCKQEKEATPSEKENKRVRFAEGEGKVDKKGKPAGVKWHCSERGGVFAKRTIRLPRTADTSAASATYTDGVLTVRFPKKAPVDTSVKLAIS
jgi:hypothetical protein